MNFRCGPLMKVMDSGEGCGTSWNIVVGNKSWFGFVYIMMFAQVRFVLISSFCFRGTHRRIPLIGDAINSLVSLLCGFLSSGLHQ